MRFFFYGTLADDSFNATAQWLHGLLGAGIPATVRGRLYAIEDALGWYPGLFPDPRGDLVHGFVHQTTSRFGPADLAALDCYEHFDPQAPSESEFLRRTLEVRCASGAVRAEAYVLRFVPTTSVVPIGDGRFSRFLKQNGYRAFAASRVHQGS